MNADIYNRLYAANPLRESILREMIDSLSFRHGSHGLDAGCGIGLQCMLLSEKVGHSGRITGVDLSPELLFRARENVRKVGLSDQISFQEGDLANLPFENATFDWAWSCDCVGYGSGDPIPQLKELVRVVKPGGIVAISAWSSENMIPGYPGLEARLRSTSSGIAPFRHGQKPEAHFLRAMGWLQESGLLDTRARVFADSFHAPLSHKIRCALLSLFEMRWEGVEAELSSEDQAEFRRLCLADSPDYILDLPDYYAFFTYTLFWGRVGE